MFELEARDVCRNVCAWEEGIVVRVCFPVRRETLDALFVRYWFMDGVALEWGREQDLTWQIIDAERLKLICIGLWIFG